MEQLGAINKYVCRVCNKHKFTLNLNTGVTPFMLMCDSKAHKPDVFMQSSFYRGSSTMSIDKLFYRPIIWPEDADPSTHEHLINGGLLLADIGSDKLIGVMPDCGDVEYEEFFNFVEQYWKSSDSFKRLLDEHHKRIER